MADRMAFLSKPKKKKIIIRRCRHLTFFLCADILQEMSSHVVPLAAMFDENGPALPF